jgi:F-type H+-transporting ATPase subunit beta
VHPEASEHYTDQNDSGIARTLGKSAFARPAVTRRAFEPLRKQAFPILSQRWASTDNTNVGKIHQVIGAVVDGMSQNQ